jgi:hypothetical protein
LRQSIPAFIRHSGVPATLTTPVIYSMLFPLALFDVWITLYQWLCFPLYRIAIVPRDPFFVVDRHKLAYLNGIEKLHCTYCSYATGVIEYSREILARTEHYWCPIQHEQAIPAPHSRYPMFFAYGDAERFRRDLGAARETLKRYANPSRAPWPARRAPIPPVRRARRRAHAC